MSLTAPNGGTCSTKQGILSLGYEREIEMREIEMREIEMRERERGGGG